MNRLLQIPTYKSGFAIIKMPVPVKVANLNKSLKEMGVQTGHISEFVLPSKSYQGRCPACLHFHTPFSISEMQL